MLCQTPDRQWEVGYVSKLPWRDDIISQSDLDIQAKEIAGTLLALRGNDITSPHYTGPALLKQLTTIETTKLFDHPHRTVLNELPVPEVERELDIDSTIHELSVAADKREEHLQSRLQQKSQYIDEYVFDLFDINAEEREGIYQEIALRTNQDPREADEYDPESIKETRENTVGYVKDLLVHLSHKTVHDDRDGIVELPTEVQSSRNTLLDLIVAEFESIFGSEYEKRLAEVDELLGSKEAGEEAYPNLRVWLQRELFEYITQTFENRPVVWKLTTEGLVSDPDGEGFACLIDYHQLDTSTFDALESQYLEPRKAELRERRNSAERRRSDESLSTTERAKATETYDCCKSGLQQIEQFQGAIQDLVKGSPPTWPQEHRDLAENLKQDVERVRNLTQQKLDHYEELFEISDEDELEELFSESFIETIRSNREEWIDALEELERAATVYAREPDQTVEAHLYDLFTYFGDELKGSVWPTSTGILSMGYYPNKQSDNLLTEDGDPKESLVDKQAKLIAQIASGFDELEQLADDVESKCDELSAKIPSEWEERARAEITTAGYKPVHKHGVVINIEPLDDVGIVPDAVNDKVL